MQEGTHQEKQGALRLMEIGYQHLHNLIGITWSDDDLRAGVKGFQSVAVEIIDDCLDSLHRSDVIHQIAICRQLVWIPLFYMQVLFTCLRMLDEMHAHIVETLDGAHTGGSHGDDLALVLDELLQTATMNHDIFGMHLMTFYLKTLHRLEGSRSYMKGYLFTVDAMRIQVLEHRIGEMQTGCWGSHTTLDLGIYGLISGLVTFFCLAVQIRRDRQLSHCFENLGKGNMLVVPVEIHPVVGAATFSHHFSRLCAERISTAHGSREGKLMTLDLEVALQASLFPFLQVTNHTEP